MEDLQEIFDVLLIWAFKGFLHDGVNGVVPILVEEDVLEKVLLLGVLVLLLAEYFEDILLTFKIAWVHEDLNDAGWVFWIAVAKEILADDFGDFFVDGLVLEVYDFAHDIVGKLVIDELFHVIDNLVDQPALLQQTSSFQTGLHHAAALLVPCNLQAILNDRLVYRVFVLIGGQNIQTSLDHVISMYVYCQLVNVVFNSHRKLCASLVWKRMDIVKQLLQRSSAMLIHSYSHKIVMNDYQYAV